MGHERTVPGHQPSPDLPFVSVETVDHSGQAVEAGSVRDEISDVDENCVDQLIAPGRPLGRWVPAYNDCNTFVDEVIGQCDDRGLNGR